MLLAVLRAVPLVVPLADRNRARSESEGTRAGGNRARSERNCARSDIPQRRPVLSVRGSVLPIGVALLFLAALLSLRQYSIAELYFAKQRVTTAADAAAYSAALWQARVLNFHAFANRAILANEVAIAQAVTLVAWADYFDQLVRNADAVGRFVPGAGPLLETAAQGSRLLREGSALGAAAEIAARSGWQVALRTSQDLLASSVTHFALNSVATEIARANDARFFAWVLPGTVVTIATQHPEGAARQRYAELVTASLDPFTAGPRDRDLALPLPSGCLISTNAEQRGLWLRKRGGTALTAGLERWEAVDTLSLHVPVRQGLLFGKCVEIETPLSWGSAQAGGRLGRVSGQVLNPQPSLQKNARALGLAAQSQENLFGYGGLIAARELSSLASAGSPEATRNRTTQTSDPVALLTVLARSEGADLRTASHLGLGSARMSPPEPLAGNRLWALASAEVYFHRPAAAPLRFEAASLLNPYWQVRMVPTPETQKLAAAAGLPTASSLP